MNSCVPHRVIWGLLAFAVCCIVDFGPCLLVCPGSSALCLDCRVSWVRVPPRAALFSLKKSVVLGAVELFALHLCYLSPHYDSCTRMAPRVCTLVLFMLIGFGVTLFNGGAEEEDNITFDYFTAGCFSRGFPALFITPLNILYGRENYSSK